MLTKFLTKFPQKNLFLSLSCQQHRNNHNCSKDSCSPPQHPQETSTPSEPEPFETLRREELKRLYSSEYKPRIPGQATSAGTKHYASRNPNGFIS